MGERGSYTCPSPKTGRTSRAARIASLLAPAATIGHTWASEPTTKSMTTGASLMAIAFSITASTSSLVSHAQNADGTPKKVRIPDFVTLAEALGCVGLRCESRDDVDAVIEKAMAITDAPFVIDFVVGSDAQVWPMVAAGASNDDILAARDLRPVFGEGQV